jgi:uncharacterized repeat protein (TIGR03803 family)
VYEYDGSAERIAYFFQPGPTGQRPSGQVLSRDGVLYGIASGGTYGAGLIYSVRRDRRGQWFETALYDFKGAPDGNDPESLLYIDPHGTLYGTTFMGGSGTACLFSTNGCGTVFALQPPANSSGSWRETILHSFQGSPDGAGPEPTLVQVGGAFYGVTVYGGSSKQCPYLQGCGSIYKLAISGSSASEQVVHSFHVDSSVHDGELPIALAAGGNGALYGTTEYGGSSSRCPLEQGVNGCGTFYTFSPKNTQVHSLYDFQGGQDGAQPDSFAGTAATGFYGVTSSGGSSGCNAYAGCGTIFSMLRSGNAWNETVLHAFDGTDGEYPGFSVVLRGTTLYGTASGGGTGHCLAGCGTIFALSF